MILPSSIFRSISRDIEASTPESKEIHTLNLLPYLKYPKAVFTNATSLIAERHVSGGVSALGGDSPRQLRLFGTELGGILGGISGKPLLYREAKDTGAFTGVRMIEWTSSKQSHGILCDSRGI